MKRHAARYYIDGILDGNVMILSQSITLVESKLFSDNFLAGEIIDGIFERTGNSLRIGITGVPGVGKSTFIEAFGETIINHGKKVAVLAIDPSSKITKGSILGDKTRMDLLGRNPGAFIRPSPTRNTLGGVAERTRESILLCEAAGFDVILVETVGVGQSEVMVDSMVDFFLLLMLAGAGDELQGIKKGIMEMVDGLIINKADGENLSQTKKAKSEYSKALHLFPPKSSGWIPQVMTCSGLEKTGLNEIWTMIERFRIELTKSGFILNNRRRQNIEWFRQQTTSQVLDNILMDDTLSGLKRQLEQEILEGIRDPKNATRKFMQSVMDRINPAT